MSGWSDHTLTPKSLYSLSNDWQGGIASEQEYPYEEVQQPCFEEFNSSKHEYKKKPKNCSRTEQIRKHII